MNPANPFAMNHTRIAGRVRDARLLKAVHRTPESTRLHSASSAIPNRLLGVGPGFFAELQSRLTHDLGGAAGR